MHFLFLESDVHFICFVKIKLELVDVGSGPLNASPLCEITNDTHISFNINNVTHVSFGITFSQCVMMGAMLTRNAGKTHIVNRPCFRYKLFHVDTYSSI